MSAISDNESFMNRYRDPTPNLIIETDLGHDPDDFFSILWLMHKGEINIQAITLVPGDLDQVAIANFLQRFSGHFKVGRSKESTKLSSGKFHYEILDRFRAPREGEADGDGQGIISRAAARFDNLRILSIGPPTNLGRYLAEATEAEVSGFDSITFQGGFCPYHIHRPKVTLSKFEGKHAVQSFNPGGDRQATHRIINSKIPVKRFIGKNVCHTVTMENRRFPDNNEASKVLNMIRGNLGNKKMHDLVAAALMLRPELGTWVKGTPVGNDKKKYDENGKVIQMYCDGSWTTVRGGDCDVLVDLDREAFWDYVYE